MFKARGNNLLQTLLWSRLGFDIGTINVSASKCVGDITLLAPDPISVQAMLYIAEHDARQDPYEDGDSKANIMIMNNMRGLEDNEA